MKPQIIINQDFGGAHNADLGATRARLVKGGSWKRQNIAVIIPAADLIPAKVALSLWSLAFPPNNGVARFLAQGLEVGDAYSSCIEQILAHPQISNWQYILCIEHDSLVPQDGVIRLLEAMEAHPEYSAISGGYWTKGPSGVFQAWGDPSDPILNYRPQLPRPGEIQEVCGIGQGFGLFRIEMFKDKRLRKPWFKTEMKEGVSTQDLHFWSDARKYGYRCAVDVDCKVGHYDFEGKFGPPDMVW